MSATSSPSPLLSATTLDNKTISADLLLDAIIHSDPG